MLLRKKSNAIEEFEAPSYALREITLPDRAPRDGLGREIAFLLAAHPEIESPDRGRDWDRVSHDEKIALLGALKESLGIRPIRTRRLTVVEVD